MITALSAKLDGTVEGMYKVFSFEEHQHFKCIFF